ncbi:hypothetical protein [Pseudomonas aeruginosa]|uniref:hypothetical protein n=1 Tax=Pseudomonas aeruginosa TaxID=287 RepID=UPI003F1A4658
MAISITRHDQDRFKQTVLQHITAKLPREEWESFRFHWCMVNQRLVPDAEPDPDLTPQQLVKEAMSSMGNETPRLLTIFRNQIEVIGETAGQPVYYAGRAGCRFQKTTAPSDWM